MIWQCVWLCAIRNDLRLRKTPLEYVSAVAWHQASGSESLDSPTAINFQANTGQISRLVIGHVCNCIGDIHRLADAT